MKSPTSIFDENINRIGTNCIKYDALKTRYGSSDLQPLWIADMDFKTPSFITETIIKKAEESLFGYSFIDDAVFNSVIEWQKRRNNWDITKDQIYFLPSVLVGMSLALETFTKEGEGVIIQTPVYPPFSLIVKDNGRKLITNPLKRDGDRYEIDFDDLISKIDKDTKMLFLCSPHNPVGRVWSKDELKKLGDICIKNNILIISDEIHSDLVYKEFTPISSIDNNIAKNTITFNSPTKTFNIAGLKIAYAHSSNKELLETLKAKINSFHIAEINSFAPEALKSGYEKGDAWVDSLNLYIYENYQYLKSFINKELPFINVGELEATYLVWLDFSNFDLTHKKIREKLINDARIVLNDGLTFGKNGNKFFRINIALSRNSLKDALNKLKNEFSN